MGIFEPFEKWHVRHEIRRLKKSMRKDYSCLKKIMNHYDCGIDIVFNVSTEAVLLKVKMDKDWKKLQELDKSCPKDSWF